MIFTRATGYAILALTELSKLESPIDSQTLASNIGVSKYFLAKLLQSLARDGIVKSFKGINGGFVLNREKNEIKIIDIFKSVEDKDFIVYECSKNEDDCPRGMAAVCSIWPFLNMLEEDIYSYLSKYTLEDVIKANN
jgi:Rrf2 family protein